jgi:hypothetical protein
MTTPHRIELDSVRKYRSAAEWRPVNRARCGEIEAVGDGSVIVACARLMLDSGMSGVVEVWRGQTKVFAAQSVEKWAGVKVGPRDGSRRFPRGGRDG